ncbi:CHASE3 domain-containing protein [Streptomyces sp. NPDC047968]|uniref:sensor histidine kinase n=1 Tax=unclassified Streptomyces TaxID=2593676 RepID=UPI003424662F
MSESGSAPRTLRGRLSTQGWIHLVLALMALVVVLAAVVGTQMLVRTQQRTDELVDRLQPARSTAFQLQKSLLDQETGIRGYALTGDPRFLEPYEQGKADEQRALAALRELVSDYPVLRQDLRELQSAGAAWRTEYAETITTPEASGTASGTGTAPDPDTAATLERSKRSFDSLRLGFARQQLHIDTERVRAREGLETARTQRNASFAVMVAAILLAAVLMAVLVNRIVGRPLRRLEEASTRVREGSFEEEISIDGPADVRAVSAAVEAMRHRIVDALRTTRNRERLLAEQTVELEEQAAELRRSNAELEQFAYVASHDLQEPLRKVASFCQLLEKRYGSELDDRGRQYIDFAVDGAKRMQVLINDLLTFSRVGRLDEHRSAVALDSTVDRALRNLGAVVEEAEAEVVRTGELPTVTVDPTLMAMVWQNLIGNAVKFRHPDRDCRVEISCDRAGEEWEFTVRDNGIGIAPEFAEKVFVIFQRLHSREEYEGTGIGLALCRKIIEHAGGRITIDSAEGCGTAIRFTLPRE